MRKIFFVLCGVVLVGALMFFMIIRPPSPLHVAATNFVLPDVMIINPGLHREPAQWMEVVGERIKQIDAAAVTGDVLTEYRGHYVLPGLINMHAHLPSDNALKLAGYFGFLFLSHGVTTIRSAGDLDNTADISYQRGINADRFPGPHLHACGPFVGGEPAHWPNSIILRESADVKPAIKELKRRGKVCIKAYDELSLDLLNELKAAAAEEQIPVLGHVPIHLSYEQALLPDAQHYFGVPLPTTLTRKNNLGRTSNWQAVDDARLQHIVDVAVQNQLTNTPTLVLTNQLLLYQDYPNAKQDPIVKLMPTLFSEVVWSPVEGLLFYRAVDEELDNLRDALEKKKQLTGMLYRAGAKLHLGTDNTQPFVVPGAAMWQEMELFRQSGIPLEAIWALATWRAGEDLGIPLLGRLVPQAAADLLIFKRDPTQSLDALDSLAAVVVGGRLYRRDDIDAAAEIYQKHFSNPVHNFIAQAAARRLMKKLELDQNNGSHGDGISVEPLSK